MRRRKRRGRGKASCFDFGGSGSSSSNSSVVIVFTRSAKVVSPKGWKKEGWMHAFLIPYIYYLKRLMFVNALVKTDRPRSHYVG